SDDARPLLDRGVTAYVSILRRPCPREDALRDAAENLEAAAEQIVRAFTAGVRRRSQGPDGSSSIL
ncbi:MAG: glycerate kinase, partial [Planctomycetia bacterium]